MACLWELLFDMMWHTVWLQSSEVFNYTVC